MSDISNLRVPHFELPNLESAKILQAYAMYKSNLATIHVDTDIDLVRRILQLYICKTVISQDDDQWRAISHVAQQFNISEIVNYINNIDSPDVREYWQAVKLYGLGFEISHKLSLGDLTELLFSSPYSALGVRSAMDCIDVDKIRNATDADILLFIDHVMIVQINIDIAIAVTARVIELKNPDNGFVMRWLISIVTHYRRSDISRFKSLFSNIHDTKLRYFTTMIARYYQKSMAEWADCTYMDLASGYHKLINVIGLITAIETPQSSSDDSDSSVDDIDDSGYSDYEP
jgi:hypothetical protein